MTQEKIAVWYAFWGETQARLGYQQICARADRFLSDLVGGLVRQLQPPPADAEVTRAISTGFIGLINILNQEMMINPGGIDAASLLGTCRSYLRFAFPDHRFDLPTATSTGAAVQAPMDQLAGCTPISPDWIATTLRDIDLNLARGLALQDICIKQRLDLKMINFLRLKYQGMSSDQIRYVIGLEAQLRQLTEALAGQAMEARRDTPAAGLPADDRAS
jgi:hypothetical protein